jgi:chromosome segregation ATPase
MTTKEKPLSERLAAMSEQINEANEKVTEAAEVLDSKVLRKIEALLNKLAEKLEAESGAAEELEGELETALEELAQVEDDDDDQKPETAERPELGQCSSTVDYRGKVYRCIAAAGHRCKHLGGEPGSGVEWD